MATDSNGLYYMRARYYNPDIKRFINQDIKVGDIGSSQSLNRYAYCEGNPVSMVDPFGLCGENTNDQGQKSKYQWLHNALDVAGLFFDAADIVNAAIYAYEKDWANAAICAASAIPAVGAAIIGVAKSAKAVIKAKKAEKIASLAAEASRMTKNAANTLDAFSDTIRVAEKYGKSAIKSADNIISEAGSKVIKAMETGGDIGKEASKAVKSAETTVSAGGLRLSTKVDDAADALKTADFYAGPKGVARSLDEYDAFVEGGKTTELVIYNPEFATRQLLDGGETTEELLRSIIPKDAKNTFVPSDTIKNGYKYNFNINGKKVEIKWHSEDLNAAVKYPGSNSGSGWTAQIKVGKKLLGQDGKFYKKAKNSTHIPLRR